MNPIPFGSDGRGMASVRFEDVPFHPWRRAIHELAVVEVDAADVLANIPHVTWGWECSLMQTLNLSRPPVATVGIARSYEAC